MIPDTQNLQGLYTGFNTLFNKGLKGAKSYYREIAMVMPSSTGENTYAWLGAMPNIREWIGDRLLHSLALSSYAVTNRKFEATVTVPREKIEDDQYGVYGPMIEKMGQDVARHPDDLVFSLLASGFNTECYDGQPFFDLDHPVGGAGGTPVVSASNVQGGTGAAWYLLDCGQPIKPMIYQDRVPFDFQSLTDPKEPNVFFKDEYVYGVRGRANAGFGLWQLAFASKAELSSENYEAARAAMMEQKGDNGKTLGITPTHLVVPPALEGAGRRILKALNPDGGTNEWADSTKLIVSHYL